MGEMNMEELPKPYWVLSPEYGTVIPVLDDGSGPMEYGRDCAAVIALDPRHAKVAAVRIWRKDRKSYINGDPSSSPYAGLEVNSAICEHGVWDFTDVDDKGNALNYNECQECQDDHNTPIFCCGFESGTLEDWRKENES